jgi:hypothetical protein
MWKLPGCLCLWIFAAFPGAADLGYPDAQRLAARLFTERHLTGALLVQDVRTGSTIASYRSGDGANGLPLSAAKLFLVAIYLEHRRQLPKSVSPTST